MRACLDVPSYALDASAVRHLMLALHSCNLRVLQRMPSLLERVPRISYCHTPEMRKVVDVQSVDSCIELGCASCGPLAAAWTAAAATVRRARIDFRIVHDTNGSYPRFHVLAVIDGSELDPAMAGEMEARA